MAETEEGHQEEKWEERALNLLADSEVDLAFSAVKARKRGARKHKVRWMSRPMAIPEVILELQDQDCREQALRGLSNFLLERRVEDPDNYSKAGFMLFNSCTTMTILLQEVVAFYRNMVDGSPSVRCSKRLANVFTLFQSIAANEETRQPFMNTGVPNFLIPVIQFSSMEEVFGNVRAIALSVIGILCQAGETNIILWAIESNMIEVCRQTVEIGNELSKVVAMHIIEAMVRNGEGISRIFSPTYDYLLRELAQTLRGQVYHLAKHQDFSPRLLFHIIRCYVVLSIHPKGIEVVLEYLPCAITDGSFNGITQEYPIIGDWHKQLLVNIGKKLEITPPASDHPGFVYHPMEETTILYSKKSRHPIFDIYLVILGCCLYFQYHWNRHYTQIKETCTIFKSREPLFLHKLAVPVFCGICVLHHEGLAVEICLKSH